MNYPKVDFFSEAYLQEQPRTDTIFGINDGIQEGNIEGFAYTTTEGQQLEWNAVVSNPSNRVLQFTPLDHNIEVHVTPDTTYSLCDGMLHDKFVLIFVELKVRQGSWISESIEQLKSTITLFKANHDVSKFSKLKAYAANRRFPRFCYSRKTDMHKFHVETGFRLLIENRITCE